MIKSYKSRTIDLCHAYTADAVAPEDETSPPIAAEATPGRADVFPAPSLSGSVQVPALIGRKYRPLRLIAKGGMGAVYEVVHANTGEHLALKLMLARSLLTPELVERFRREARIHSSVKSEHVVRVVDADVAPELDDAPFLVMELLVGQDFERLCLERKPSVAEIVDWMRQLAAALDKAHREGIVHRDLKPENLYLAEREGLPPIVKILDFGIAKITAEGEGNSTATGQILGTPRYMAPEQAVGAKEVSAAADRFALGLIAFRLLCGRHYFTGDNWVGLLREVARGPVARPSALGSDRGSAFDGWFARACAPQPGDRFANCVEQVEALAQALAGVGVARRPWGHARTGAAIAVACGLAATLVWGSDIEGAWRLGRRLALRSKVRSRQPDRLLRRRRLPLRSRLLRRHQRRSRRSIAKPRLRFPGRTPCARIATARCRRRPIPSRIESGMNRERG